jgi:hypothetical protein
MPYCTVREHDVVMEFYFILFLTCMSCVFIGVLSLLAEFVFLLICFHDVH